MESVEAEGESVESATDSALLMLGVERDRVDIEVLGTGSRGLLGFGSRRARVRVTLRPEGAPPAPLTQPTAVNPPVYEELEVLPTPTRPTSTRTPPSQPAPGRSGGNRSTGNRSSGNRSNAPRSDAGPRSQSPQRSPDAPRQPEKPRPPAAPRPPAPARSEPESPIDAALVEKARGILQEIIAQIGAEATVNVRQEEESAVLDIASDGSGLMIGRRGQMLDALEYVLNRIVLKDQTDAVRLVVDSENYRSRRRASLEEMALRMAEQAKQRQRPVMLNPMSPRDRRIIHLALQGDSELTTKSSGEGFYRKLVILPKGVNLGRGRDRGRGRGPRERAGDDTPPAAE